MAKSTRQQTPATQKNTARSGGPNFGHNPTVGPLDRVRVDSRTLEFIKDQYRHCKPLLAWGDSAELLDACGIPTTEPDPGLIVAAIDAPDAGDCFVAAIAKHRHFVRETDPPRV